MYCMVFVTVSKIKIRKISDTASSTMLQKISCSVKDLEIQNDLQNYVTIFKLCKKIVIFKAKAPPKIYI